MGPLKGHWGTRTDNAFLYQIGFQFVTQLEDIMRVEKMGRAELAEKLGVSKGRVSQILNDPGNLTLKNIVRYTRALDRQASVVAYRHDDSENDGPIHPEIFVACWERAGKPTDFSSASAVAATSMNNTNVSERWRRSRRVPKAEIQQEVVTKADRAPLPYKLDAEDLDDHARTNSDQL